jgi:hypothetical protein
MGEILTGWSVHLLLKRILRKPKKLYKYIVKPTSLFSRTLFFFFHSLSFSKTKLLFVSIKEQKENEKKKKERK